MALLRSGSEQVCAASDIRAALRNLIVPKVTGSTDVASEQDERTAINALSLSYDLTTLKAFDAAVARAQCNTTVKIAGADGKPNQYRIDYEISPAAENAATFVVTADTDDAAAFARGIVEVAVRDATERHSLEQMDSDAKLARQKLLAAVSENWMMGAWIDTGTSGASCSNGQAIWFEKGHVLEGGLGKGRWALAEDVLHLVANDGTTNIDQKDTITAADAVSFSAQLPDGKILSLRRCTREEVQTLPAATGEEGD